MTKTLTKLIMLLSIAMLLIAPTVAEEEGQITIGATYSEVVISADPLVSIIGYTVNGESNRDRITVLSRDTVVISVNRIPSGMILKTVATINGDEIEQDGNPVTLSGFPSDTPISIPVHLSFVSSSGSDDTPTIPGTIPTYTPTTPTPTETQSPDVEPENPGEAEGNWNILPLVVVAGIVSILLLVTRRKVYRILKSSAKRYGFKTERTQLKEISKEIIRLLHDNETYPEWRKNHGVEQQLRSDIIRLLDEMEYPAVPRDEIVSKILKTGKGLFTRYRL